MSRAHDYNAQVVDKDGEPAKPGDLLCVEICNLGPLPGDEWGYTGIFDRDNGGGFLTDHFPNAGKGESWWGCVFGGKGRWTMLAASARRAEGVRLPTAPP